MILVMSDSIHIEVLFIWRNGAHSCQHLELHLSTVVAKGDNPFLHSAPAVNLPKYGFR